MITDPRATSSANQLAIPPTAEDGGLILLPWLREMRDGHPVWRDLSGAWHVFRYADVARVLSEPHVFSSDVSRVIPAVQRLSEGSLLLTDPPRHHQLRRLVGAVFNPNVVTGLVPRIAEITHELLDATSGATEFDLVSTLAYPLPVTVIAELLGLPTSDRELFRIWTDRILALDATDPNEPQHTQNFDDVTTELLAQKIDSAAGELFAYLHEHCQNRRRHPRDDLITRLATVAVGDQRLTDEEVVNFSFILLLNGYITTTALLGNAVLCLDAHPQVWSELHMNRSLVSTALEEVLRYRSPFTEIRRVTVAKAELAGHAIPAGVIVTLWLLSANRDEREFPEPDRFDIHRFPNHHLAFGHGIHFCIGQLLARVEARVAINILLDRYVEIRVASTPPLEFFHGNVFAARNIPVAV